MANTDRTRDAGPQQGGGRTDRHFFLVAGDPTRDLKAIKRIRMVVKDGVVYFPSEIYPHFGIKPFAEPPKLTAPKS